MTDAAPAQPSYYDDGHTIFFLWAKDEISIDTVHCPYVGEVATCNRGRHSCVVDTYLKVYGTALNIGEAYINGPVEIAWIPVPGQSEFDDEFAQVWIIPVDDENFQLVAELDQVFELELPSEEEDELPPVEPEDD